jgi:hypothetical protein
MNFISNLYNYIADKINYFYNTNKIETNNDKSKNCNQLDIEINNIIYIYINTANIYNATELMLKRLKTDELNNKYIKIYLLKSHTLKPLFNNELKVNNKNLRLIEKKLAKKRRHLHTFIDAIDSHIEYNNIRNYNIYY